jgi:hypothetical protein
MRFAALLVACLVITAGPLAARQAVPTPESHLGFAPGTDGRLASWDALVSYYERLAETSDRVMLRQLGLTTRENPFLLLTISSPENLARLDRLQEISRRMADPRGLSDSDVDDMVAEGKAVVAVTVGLHSTEVGATQMAPVLSHRLATAQDAQTQRILDETVFLFFPSFNPDGHEVVVEWVDETRGTEWAGSRIPDMYHEYVGHDNNRDGYMLTQNEAQFFAQVVYREWVPQMYLDVHQMGSYSARLYVPPYDDPLNPNVDPLIWIEHQHVGAAMQMALEREGLTGVATGTYYEGYWFPSFHMATNHHNITGMLTESASANMAEPLYIHEEQLQAQGKKSRVAGLMQNQPHPWAGGWWRVRDIMRQQEISTYALLQYAAANRETVLRNMVLKARRTIDRGRTEPPFGFIVPADQHDPLTTRKFITILMNNGVEVGRATSDFVQGGRAFHAGDFIVSTSQPNGVLVRSLMESTFYPDNALTRRADHSIVRPYDMANFVLAEHMGVTAVPVMTDLVASTESIIALPSPAGEIRGNGSAGWVVSHALNDAFRVVNRVLADGGDVYWLKETIEAGGTRFAPGAMWIPAGRTRPQLIQTLAQETGVDFTAVAAPPSGDALQLRPLRLGTYRRYLGEQLDEGWSRFLFDTWGFPYQRIEADGVRDGALRNLDVFLIPADDLGTLKGDGDVTPPGEGEADEYPDQFLPAQYTEGLDEEAITAIKMFVRRGGTLVLLDEASQLAMEELGVPIENVVEGLPPVEFFSPGSNLWARFDQTHPLAYGMPERALIVNWGSPVFELDRTPFNGRITVPIRYIDRNIAQSGWLIGEDHIAGQAAAVDVEYGEGRILMIGFRAQHRAQNHGTFKVFFNALYYGPARDVTLGTPTDAGRE